MTCDMHLVCYTAGYNLYTLAPILINEAYYRSFTDDHIQSVFTLFIFKICAALIPSTSTGVVAAFQNQFFPSIFLFSLLLRIIMKTDTNTDDMHWRKLVIQRICRDMDIMHCYLDPIAHYVFRVY